MEIYFDEVTPYNWKKVNSLQVKAEQKHFVASNVAILAKAFAYRKDKTKIAVIYYQKQPIGLIMQRDFKEYENLICILDQFMIDKAYQGRGLGKQALQLWLSCIKAENKYIAIELCYKDTDYLAENLYKRLGFMRKPEDDEADELAMRYDL
jgi:diamine N-acetyltransferase